jgi:transposase
MQDAIAIELIETKYRGLAPLLDERLRRQWAAAEATAYGWGGQQAVAQATGLSRQTIRKGQAELAARQAQPELGVPARLRGAGAGRQCKTAQDLALLPALERLVDPVTRGDPESPLRWTCKSSYELARALTAQGHTVSARTVQRLLHAAGYSLQSNRKTREGSAHPDRNAQFERINELVRAFRRLDNPPFPLIRKRKNWSAISRMPGVNGNPKDNRRPCASTIFRTRLWAKPFRMASMICCTIKVGSAWALTMTPRGLPLPPCDGGGAKWAAGITAKRVSCW